MKVIPLDVKNTNVEIELPECQKTRWAIVTYYRDVLGYNQGLCNDYNYNKGEVYNYIQVDGGGVCHSDSRYGRRPNRHWSELFKIDSWSLSDPLFGAGSLVGLPKSNECDCGAEKHGFPFHVRNCPGENV